MAASQYIELQPALPQQAHCLLAPVWTVLQQPRYLGEDLNQAFRQVRQALNGGLDTHADRLAVRLFVELLEDLVDQGWLFKAAPDDAERTLLALPPGARNGRPIEQEEVKRRIRASLVAARNEQLREEAIRRFVLDMERPRWHKGRQVSVQNLLVAPRALAEDLQRRLQAPATIREGLLRDAISPYVQQATEALDEHTGLRLIDIWRYCRYTWSMPFHGQPGRRMYYLVRDAARDDHPIIGIGALGNSIVQIKCRDERVGWTLSSLKHAGDVGARMAALEAEIDRAIADVFWEDLVAEDEVAAPDDDTLARLEAAIARMPKASERQQGEGVYDTLVDEAQSPRYTRKRAQVLFELLRAKRTLRQATEAAASPEARAALLLRNEEGRRALKMALRSLKKRHVGSSIMDITTCGALPPYGTLLGGKLVSLLMASPQVVADYRRRYADASSVIASRMKGDDVVRPAHLVLLGTTSLYHVGSSQYNRLRAPVARGILAFEEVGKTLGYGSVHLSRRTYQTLQDLLREHPDLGQQSNRFAAGVNYKIRSIASALGWLGMSKLQQHHMPLRTTSRQYHAPAVLLAA